jgi:hypothetical protein
MAKVPPALTKKWEHSPAEDTDTEQVFRPVGHPKLPELSRGRRRFELRPDGGLVEEGPGADDRTKASSGTWTYDGTDLTFSSGAQRPARRYRVSSVAADKLVLQK